MTAAACLTTPMTLAERLGVMRDIDFKPAIFTAKVIFGIKPEEARMHLGGFQQWFATVPHLPSGLNFAMLEGPTDTMFHSAVLNTEWYQKDLCGRVIGPKMFVDHSPIDQSKYAKEVLAGATRDTIDFLKETYGASLHPDIARWEDKLNKGTFQVYCLNNHMGRQL